MASPSWFRVVLRKKGAQKRETNAKEVKTEREITAKLARKTAFDFNYR